MLAESLHGSRHDGDRGTGLDRRGGIVEANAWRNAVKWYSMHIPDILLAAQGHLEPSIGLLE